MKTDLADDICDEHLRFELVGDVSGGQDRSQVCGGYTLCSSSWRPQQYVYHYLGKKVN